MPLFKDLKLENATSWSRNSRLHHLTMRCNTNLCESRILAESSINTIGGEFIRKFTKCSVTPTPQRKRKVIENVNKVESSPTSALYSDCKVALTVQPHFEDDEDLLNINIENTSEGHFESPLLKGKRNNDLLKLNVLNMICCSLFDNGFAKLKRCAKNTIENIAVDEPEFILKAAVYCRRELNIRTVTNYMVALACSIKNIHPFIEKYFSAAVRLPSDWIEVAQYYHSLNNYPRKFKLPKVLRKCMVMKFPEFDDYQLAKHNKNRSQKAKRQKSKTGKGDDNKGDNSRSPSTSTSVRLTLKYLIRYLHISEPVRPVMCLLGKPYPTNAMEFVRLGLGEEWDFNLAGKRMKLPNPVTWETELSAKGNKAKIWEELIESEKLPYMAALRNLRNLLEVGVSLTTHETVIKKLTNPLAVANSKQLPLQFFVAYKILHTLEQKLKYNAILGKVAGIVKFCAQRKRIVSANIQKLAKKKAVVKPLCYDLDLLKKYRCALDVAFGLSTRYNLPPIPGHSIIICNPPSSSKKGSWSLHGGLSNDPASLCILLATMCNALCESASVYFLRDIWVVSLQELIEKNKHSPLPEGQENVLKRAHILQCWQKVKQEHNIAYLRDLLDTIIVNRQPLDSIFMFGEMIPEVDMFVAKYQSLVGRLNAIYSSSETSMEHSGLWTQVPGFTDQVLRFAAETNRMKCLIEHVDRIDEIFGLDQVRIDFGTGSTVLRPPSSLVTVERPLHSEWRCARVFISSTFRDMHGERDLICGLLLPELRRLAAHRLRVHLTEVDLRWGVPEEVACSPQALTLCLEHAANADLFVLLVGNRYGWIPKQALIDALPKPLLQRVGKFYSPGMSITEMEYHIVKHTILSRMPVSMKRQLNTLRTCEQVQNQIFAFIRDPKAIDVISAAEKVNFEESSESKRERLNSFKELLKGDGVVIMDKYTASFTGVVQGRPMMSSLNEFASALGRALFRALSLDFSSKGLVSGVNGGGQFDSVDRHNWFGFLHLYVESVAREIAPRQLADIENMLVKDVLLRGKQCRSLRLLAEKPVKSTNPRFQDRGTSDEGKDGADGCLLLVTGCSGCGKTTHLAALAMRLAEPKSWQPHPYRVVSEGTCRPPALVPATTVWGRGRLASPAAHVVLAHFTEGLPATGLTCSRRLYGLLGSWAHQLANDLAARSVSSPLLSSLLAQVVCPDDAQGSSAQDTSLGEKVAWFKRLLKVAGSLTHIRYAFLLDDADHIQPSVFEWLPDILPQNMLFVFTCDSTSSVARSLSRRPDCLAFVVSPLTLTEKAAAVRSLLARYGKVLNESGISNQLLKLVNKRGSTIPLYLKLACEELRLHATYEELDAQIKQLPESLSNLVNHVIARVEGDCGSALTQAALGLLCESQTPLSVDQLKHLLEVWLSSPGLNSTTDSPGNFTVSADSRWRRIAGLQQLGEREALIASLLDQQQGGRRQEKGQEQAGSKRGRKRLTPLAFHWLLAGLRPLLADTGDQATTGDDSCEEEEQSREWTHDWWLRLRSPDILKAVRSICFKLAGAGDRLLPFNILGYHKSSHLSSTRPTSVGSGGGSGSSKRSKITIDIPLTDGPLPPVGLSQIHWLLATALGSVEYKVYHLILADELELAFHLLTSPTYLLARMSTGLTSRNPVEDYQLFDETYRRQATKVDVDMSQLCMMRKFITNHYYSLCSYPWLFTDLAYNQSPNNWIHRLANDFSPSPRKEDQGDHHVLRCSWPFPDAPATDAWMCLSSPLAVYRRPVSNQTQMTALAVSPDGELMAYGTSAGSVALVEVRTMREKCTYYGHSASILSLCFISKRKSASANSPGESPVALLAPSLSSELVATSPTSGATVVNDCWLASCSQDGSTNVWSTVKGTGSLICLTNSRGGGYPRRPVTSCAWHPDRRLLATGSLDCALTLWNLGWSDDALDRNMIPVGNRDRQLRFTRFRTGGSPVNAIAFRLPDHQLTETRSHDASTVPCDVVAAGCWDGTVRLYDLLEMRPVKILRGSCHSITSLAFSPSDGGAQLAGQDISGQLLLWNSDNLSLLGGVLSTNTTSDAATTGDIAGIALDSCGMAVTTSLNYHGQICYSQPTGRHLIQSTSAGLLKVWSGQLGVPLIPWSTVGSVKKTNEPQVGQPVTAFTCDPRGQILITGLVNGDLVWSDSSASGRPTWMTTSPDFGSHSDRTRVQAVACSTLVRPDGCEATRSSSSSLLAVFGFASGAVRVYHYKIKYPGTDDTKVKTSIKSVTLVDSYWPHSISDGGVGDSGGTLCVAADAGVAVSGGGNCQCWLAFFTPPPQKEKKASVQLVKQFRLTDPAGAVTAVALDGNLLAAGTNARAVHMYTLDREECRYTPQMVVNHAARDWITALSWLRPHAADSLPILVVGSLDQKVTLFKASRGTTSGREWKELQCTRGPGGAVVAVSTYRNYVAAGSAEGLVRLWKFNTIKQRLDTQTTLDWSLAKRQVTGASADPVGQIVNIKLFGPAEPVEPARPKNRAGCFEDSLGKASSSSIACENWTDSGEESEAQEEKAEAMEVEIDVEELGIRDQAADGYPGRADGVEGDAGAAGPSWRRHARLGDDTQLSSRLRLLVGQRVADTGSPDSFRFCALAPLLPELCYTLPGHAGVPVGGLVAGPGGTLVSLASEPEASSSGGLNSDIRLWQLFSAAADAGADGGVARLEHCEAVTCIDAQPKEQPCLIVSGSLDGTVILSMGDHFEQFVNLRRQDDRSPTFAPLLRLSFGSEPIVSLSCGFLPDSTAFDVFVAASKQIWHLRLSTSILATLQQRGQQYMTISQLLQLAEAYDRSSVTVSSITLPGAVVEMASYESVKTDLVVSCTDEVLRAVSFSGSSPVFWPLSDRDSQLWYRCVRLSRDTISMLTEAQTRVVAETSGSWHITKNCLPTDIVARDGQPIPPKDAECCTFGVDKRVKPSRTLKLETQHVMLNEEQRMTFLVPFASTLPDKKVCYYLVVKTSSNRKSVTLAYDTGQPILEFEPVPASVSITAIGCVPLTADAKTVLAVIADSDGRLHLYKLTQDATTTVRMLGFYPTGEKITALHVSQEEPIRVSVGCQSGKVYAFRIAHP